MRRPVRKNNETLESHCKVSNTRKSKEQLHTKDYVHFISPKVWISIHFDFHSKHNALPLCLCVLDDSPTGSAHPHCTRLAKGINQHSDISQPQFNLQPTHRFDYPIADFWKKVAVKVRATLDTGSVTDGIEFAEYLTYIRASYGPGAVIESRSVGCSPSISPSTSASNRDRTCQNLAERDQ